MTAEIYIGVVDTVIEEDKEDLIADQLSKFKDFAAKNATPLSKIFFLF